MNHIIQMIAVFNIVHLKSLNESGRVQRRYNTTLHLHVHVEKLHC